MTVCANLLHKIYALTWSSRHFKKCKTIRFSKSETKTIPKLMACNKIQVLSFVGCRWPKIAAQPEDTMDTLIQRLINAHYPSQYVVWTLRENRIKRKLEAHFTMSAANVPLLWKSGMKSMTTTDRSDRSAKGVSRCFKHTVVLDDFKKNQANAGPLDCKSDVIHHPLCSANPQDPTAMSWGAAVTERAGDWHRWSLRRRCLGRGAMTFEIFWMYVGSLD